MTVHHTELQYLPGDLKRELLPKHVAVIMDGNGRWAKRQGLPRIMGHKRGVDALKDLLRCCKDWGISALTAYAFSTDNSKRPQEEVEFLKKLRIIALFGLQLPQTTGDDRKFYRLVGRSLIK